MREGEDHGKGLVGFWKFNFGKGALWVTASVDEEFVKGSVGRETEPDGATGESVFLELEEVGSKMIGGEVTPFGEFVAEPFAEEAEGEGVVFERFGRRILLGGHELDEGIEFVVGQ